MHSRSFWIELLLAANGIVAVIYFFSWWGVDERYRSPLLLILAAAVVYIGCQMAGSWILNLAAKRAPTPPAPPAGLSVAVFVTACREPLALVREALAAALAMHGTKRVRLLDDGDDPTLAELAHQFGSGYLARREHHDAKAGNINAALPRTQGDVIAIFDIDHAPRPDFLEKSLGHFHDPGLGFVQVMVPSTSLLGAVVLVYASWPIYLLAWTLAVLRLPVGFRPTPKDGETQLNILWLMPQLVTLVLLLVGEYQTMAVYHHPPSVILWFSIAQAFLQLMLLARWVQEDWHQGGVLSRRLGLRRADT